MPTIGQQGRMQQPTENTPPLGAGTATAAVTR